MPTVVNLVRYAPPIIKAAGSEGPPCIGWIAQGATAVFLIPYAPLFKRLAADSSVRFSDVGFDAPRLSLLMDFVPCTEQTELVSIGGFDIGIMPLVDEHFQSGKCGYKLVQYMACGLPVVASPVGVSRRIVEHGVNDLLAETLEQ